MQHLKENGCCFDAVCIQETWLSSKHDTSLLQLEGYNLVSKPYRCSSHAGLAIYLKQDLKYSELEMSDNESNLWEGQFLKIKLSNYKTITVGNIYRLPKYTNENCKIFFDELNATLTYLRGDIILSGDFNIDLLKIREQRTANDFLELVLTTGYLPKITMPTRFTINKGALIDNQFCKISSNSTETTSGIILSNISDHLPYFTCLNILSQEKSSPKFVTYRIQNEKAITEFRNYLKEQQIHTKLNNGPDANPDSNYNILHEIIQNGMNKYMPLKTRKFNKYRHRNSKWISQGIIHSIQYRDKLYQKVRQTPTTSPMHNQLSTNLKTYNKILKKAIQVAKKQYYEKQFNRFKNDIKHTWTTIKDILNKTCDKKKNPDAFNINNRIVNDSQEVADEFNKFFIGIGPRLASEIPPVDNEHFSDYLKNPCPQILSFRPLSENDVMIIIEKLCAKSSCGFDNLSNKLLKDLKTELCKPLTLIINQSLRHGIFPEKLKIAKVIPVYKNGDETITTNYRPISLLPSISKIFEKVIFSQIHNHFKLHQLYFPSQYGFRELHSTEHAAIELIDKITLEMDRGNIPITIFIDMSKAFDTINHDILLKKLEHYGIRELSLSLLRSYLENRKQFVQYDKHQSQELHIKTGVPQGSILGPLLFLIYINDLHHSTSFFHLIKYADDITLLTSLTKQECNCQKTIQNINDNLETISKWLKLNKLSINVSKTKCIAFHMPQKKFTYPKIFLCKSTISYVHEFNYLGIIFNENLNWKNHTNYISNKISKTIGVMRCLKHEIPQHILKTIYYSLIHSHLNYGILCWGWNNKQVATLQKKAIRVVTNSKYNAHTEPLFKKMRILKFQDIIYQKLYKFFHRYLTKLLPDYFIETSFVKVLKHHYGTRNRLFEIPKISHKYAENCVRYQLACLLNQTDKTIFEIALNHSEFAFAMYIKKYLINNYSETCTVPCCHVCSLPN